MQGNENNIYQEIYNKLEKLYKTYNCVRVTLDDYYVYRKEPDWLFVLNDGTEYILTKTGNLYDKTF